MAKQTIDARIIEYFTPPLPNTFESRPIMEELKKDSGLTFGELLRRYHELKG